MLSSSVPGGVVEVIHQHQHMVNRRLRGGCTAQKDSPKGPLASVAGGLVLGERGDDGRQRSDLARGHRDGARGQDVKVVVHGIDNHDGQLVYGGGWASEVVTGRVVDGGGRKR